MAHRIVVGGTRFDQLAAAVMVVTCLVLASGTGAAAETPRATATLTLQPTSGTAATTITATFHVQIGDEDDNHCDLTAAFRWDGRLLNTHFTEGCTAHYVFSPLPGARGAGTHQVTAQDLHSGARASAAFTIIAPTPSRTNWGGLTGRTMANSGGGSGTAGTDGGETAGRPQTGGVPTAPPRQPLAYPGVPRGAAASFPLLSWMIGASVLLVIAGGLVILLVFAQLPTQRARHVRYLRLPDQIRDSARSLLRQGGPIRRARRGAKSASPGVSA